MPHMDSTSFSTLYHHKHSLYLDVDQSIKPSMFGFDKNPQKNCENSPFQHESKKMIGFNFFCENLLDNSKTADLYSLNSQVFAESFNYYLNKVYQQNDQSFNAKSFSIDSILNSSKNTFVSESHSMINEINTKKNFNLNKNEPSSYVDDSCSFGSNNLNCSTSFLLNKGSDMLMSPGTSLSPSIFTKINKNSNKISKIKSSINNNSNKNKSFHETNKRPTIKSIKMLDKTSISTICNNLNKSKRVRTIFTPEQLERLEVEFEKQQYMVGNNRLYLASTLNLSEAQVKVWFQNRRIKWRKQHLEVGLQAKSFDSTTENDQ